ncbi:uncharacterized protein LOC142357027 [Convolutriloba macropyga]|uniref:uncharacterized protein LOC142357027 n=1 Tax=Convolutriloba macropyga TaxID=536237 RepID=UPI003F523503
MVHSLRAYHQTPQLRGTPHTGQSQSLIHRLDQDHPPAVPPEASACVGITISIARHERARGHHRAPCNAGVQSSLQACDGKKVALVPTMGYLHAGHLSLVESARKCADVVVVSIYVNPTQFRVGEDFDAYPRDVEGDREKLRAVGVDVAFEPPSLYTPAPTQASTSFVVGQDGHTPGAHETFVQVEELQKGLCGITRPHFFRGVATICTKLFHIVEPDVAVFGRKDYQQWRIISRMVRDLDFDIEIIGMPLKREEDGIAMSRCPAHLLLHPQCLPARYQATPNHASVPAAISRNVRLTPDERKRALSISKGLKWAQAAVAEGVTEAPTIRTKIVNMISEAGGTVDYVEICHAENLNPVDAFGPQDTIIAIAAKFGSVRLLDNIEIAKDPAAAA